MAEPILAEDNNRHTFFPIQYPDLYALYKKQLACFWTTDEIDFSKDRDAFLNLNENEQHFIKHILAFFAASDGIVMENLVGRFMEEIKSMRSLYVNRYDYLRSTAIQQNTTSVSSFRV